jgi:hypothetical protein
LLNISQKKICIEKKPQVRESQEGVILHFGRYVIFVSNREEENIVGF